MSPGLGLRGLGGVRFILGRAIPSPFIPGGAIPGDRSLLSTG
jgi:hypothetical protein